MNCECALRSVFCAACSHLESVVRGGEALVATEARLANEALRSGEWHATHSAHTTLYVLSSGRLVAELPRSPLCFLVNIPRRSRSRRGVIALSRFQYRATNAAVRVVVAYPHSCRRQWPTQCRATQTRGPFERRPSGPQAAASWDELETGRCIVMHR